MADRKIVYRSDTQLTITLASLATSASLVAGRESTAYDNTSNLDLDALLSGKITTGTSPTTAKLIQVWVVPILNDTPTWPDVFDGTDSAETVTSADILAQCGRLAASMKTDATSDRTYAFNAGSVAALFGGVLPSKFVVFVTHNTGVNLNSTAGNHEISIQGVYETVA
jgi:hypothetical protein